MLSALLAAGRAAGTAAAERARVRLATALRTELPEVGVAVEDEAIVLSGPVRPEDPRLRWIGSLLR